MSANTDQLDEFLDNSIILSKIESEDLKDYLLDTLNVEQLNELIKDTEEELQIREIKEKRLTKMKKELQRKKIIFKRQLKDEEDEERSKMQKRIKKTVEDEDWELPKKKGKK